jgi:hypothetical protein
MLVEGKYWSWAPEPGPSSRTRPLAVARRGGIRAAEPMRGSSGLGGAFGVSSGMEVGNLAM